MLCMQDKQKSWVYLCALPWIWLKKVIANGMLISNKTEDERGQLFYVYD